MDYPVHASAGIAPGFKLRVLLTQAIFSNPDILLLDEPTNNLDIHTIQWLEDTLNNRNSSMIIISHDRHLLKNTVDQFYLVAQQKVDFFDGTLADYQAWLKNNLSKNEQQETPPGMIAIEGGTFTMGKVQDDVMHDWNNSPNQQHVQSFYMDETEVTNLMYLEYLDWIKRVYPPTEDNFKKIYWALK